MKWVPRIAAKSSGGVTGFCLAMIYVVFFIVSVATTTLLSAWVYLKLDQPLARQLDTREVLRRLDFSFQQHTDGHLDDGLGFGCFVPLHLVHTDIVLSITGGCEFWHV